MPNVKKVTIEPYDYAARGREEFQVTVTLEDGTRAVLHPFESTAEAQIAADRVQAFDDPRKAGRCFATWYPPAGRAGVW
jgi:hypothetical protein